MPTTVYRAESTVRAPVEAVWEVLTDLPAYPSWNPFTIEVVAPRLEPGARVDMVVMIGERRQRQREYVCELIPGHRIDWETRGRRWLVHGRRRQELIALEDGTTRYVTEDVIRGAIAPLVRWQLGRALDAGFVAMARALAAETERRVGA